VESLDKSRPNLIADIYHDTSRPIEKRLNVIVSNIFIGLVLIFFTMALLINFRIAAVVTLGIPFSFAIGLIILHFMGYTINIVSLLGALIVIGIVVDDAVVVAENIQRYIDEGMQRSSAVLKGVEEMVLPVTLATLTTFAAFLPLFMLSGEISHFIILIPVVVVAVLAGSLIESFLFLPLHAKELLSKERAMVDWAPLQRVYERSLRYCIRYKKSFLLLIRSGQRDREGDLEAQRGAGYKIGIGRRRHENDAGRRKRERQRIVLHYGRALRSDRKGFHKPPSGSATPWRSWVSDRGMLES